ncbi:hypothetical protein MHK_009455 [Candidatus Magnetomorum sp. HK-1]|nr:hypothetical protein MHK_009455 [Candidatus Magnetomorum sp. HK-1]
MKPGEVISCFEIKTLFVKRSFWLMLFCLHWVSQDFAICSDIEKNIISFPNIQVASNHTGTIEINLDNQESISSGQIEFEYDSTIGFDIDEAEASTVTRTKSFVIAHSKVSTDPENVKVLLIFYSMLGTPIEPGSGSIIKLVYKTSEEASGETSIQINVAETILSDESGNELALSYENGLVYIDDKPPVVEKPVLKNPPDNSVLNLTGQQLSTNPFSDLNDDTYHQKTHWQVSSDSYYSTLILDIESEKSLTSLLIFKIMLKNDTTYFWRVCFSNGNQFSEWSDSFSFTIENQQNNDKNANGISDSQDLTDTTLDLDNNDVSDIYQDDFKCLKAMKGNISIGVKSNEDTIIESIESIDSSSITDTTNKPDITLPYGLIGFRLKGNPGFKSDVDIYLSTPLPDNSIWYKYDYLNGWFDYSEHTTISSDRKTVTVMLQDGEFGDLDGTKNGIIVDPSGPGIQNITKPGNKIDNDYDNSNCFISTILWHD